MTWSPSPDHRCGWLYYISVYMNGEGYAIDTVFDPAATNYSVLRPIYSHQFSESYVIAAIDSSAKYKSSFK